MGRILRKKPVGLKKRKRQNDEVSSSESGSETASGSPGGAAADAAAPRKAPVPALPVASAPPADTFWTRSVQFLREVRTELKKVTWPTRKQTLGSTAVVLVLVLIISLFLGLVDMGLAGIVGLIFR